MFGTGLMRVAKRKRPRSAAAPKRTIQYLQVRQNFEMVLFSLILPLRISSVGARDAKGLRRLTQLTFPLIRGACSNVFDFRQLLSRFWLIELQFFPTPSCHRRQWSRFRSGCAARMNLFRHPCAE